MVYLLLVLSLVLIIVGAMLLTDGSVALAKRLRVPEFIVGLTVVAVGTSMPELTVSLISSFEGGGDMAIGNVVGSNIFNVLMILGVCAVVAPILFSKSNIRRDIPLAVVTSVMLVVVTLINENITRLEGLILLVGYVALMWYTIRAEKRAMAATPTEEAQGSVMPVWRIPVWIILGLAGLVFGGDMFVDSASDIAREWGVSEATIAITLVAGGTSLPELASSIVSIMRGSPSLALGNVLGSCVANILLILGVCSTVNPLTMGDVAMSDIYVALGAVCLLMLSALIIGRDKLTRGEGLFFIIAYVVYIYTLL